MMWDGPFGGWGGGFGWLWPLHFIIPIVFWALIIAAIILLVRYAIGWSGHGPSERRSPGLDVLEERYARGEINRDEYLQKKRDLLG